MEIKMDQLNKENLQVLRQIRSLGRTIERATKRISKQREIRRDAKERFRELLMSYPQARYCYYYR
jgi:chromosome segregation ATPase